MRNFLRYQNYFSGRRPLPLLVCLFVVSLCLYMITVVEENSMPDFLIEINGKKTSLVIYNIALAHSLLQNMSSSSDVSSVIQKVMVAPAKWSEPYRLKEMEKTYFAQAGQDSKVANIFSNKTHGLFLEAGALDGEKLSNTLYLERELNWTGVLVEPVPSSFNQLLHKRRKSHMLNACLSDSSETHNITLSYPRRDASLATTHGNLFLEDRKIKRGVSVTCFPLYSILKAYNHTVIDYFSLDVEGMEMKILKSIPWNKVSFKIIGVEINHVVEGRRKLQRFMEFQGYKLFSIVHVDYFFYNPKYWREFRRGTL